jgi:glycosyltransferase involved in cell wall biosynthesis
MGRGQGSVAAARADGDARQRLALAPEAAAVTHVVIAAHGEGAVIGDVVRSARALGVRVVVVDDGSADDTSDRALEAGATVLRHVANRGQGAALQTGIAFALREGAGYVVTFDADGQHRSADIVAALEPLLAGRAEVALGSRFLGATADLPPLRRLVLRLAVRFTRLSSGLRVTDTHNGLRAFTRRAAQRVRIRLDRMAHASEILDQVRESGLAWTEVPVHVRYTAYSRAKGQRTSAALRILVDYVIGRWLR